jgi:hypothetical protein
MSGLKIFLKTGVKLACSISSSICCCDSQQTEKIPELLLTQVSLSPEQSTLRYLL